MPRVSPWLPLHLKSSARLGIRVVLPGCEVHSLLPFPCPQLWGTPPGIHRGLFQPPEGGNHLHSFLSAGRGEGRACEEDAGPEGWQAAGWSGESEEARLGRVAGEGFSHSSLELGEAGSRQDGVPEGGERHTTASIPLLPTGTSDFSERVGGFLIGISPTAPHTHPPLPSLLGVPPRPPRATPPAARRPE